MSSNHFVFGFTIITSFCILVTRVSLLEVMARHYYLRDPREQLFHKLLVFGFFVYDLKAEYWTGFKLSKNVLLNYQRRITKYICSLGVVSQVTYFFLNYSKHEFQTLAMMYSIIPVSLMLILKVVLSQTSSHKQVMKKYEKDINLHNLYDQNGHNQKYLEQIIIKTEKYIRWSHIYIYLLMLVSSTAFLIAPIVRNIENNHSIHNITTRLEIVVHLWLPFDYEFNFYNYIAIQIIIIYLVFFAITLIALFDTLNLLFIYHLLGHVIYFKYKVKMLMMEEKYMNDEEVKDKLIEITRYYNLINSMKRDIEAAYGLNIVGMYLHNLIAGGIQIYQLMNAGNDTGALLSYGLMTPIYMGELMIFSLAFEELRIQANEISTLVYRLHWEKMSLQNQKLVLMILFQVQPKFEFAAAFKTKTGVQPAMSIIKTTFSYYVMIKARI